MGIAELDFAIIRFIFFQESQKSNYSGWYSKKSRPNSTFNAKNYPKPCQNGGGGKISPSHYKIVASRYSVAPHWTLFNYSKSGNYDDMMNSKLWNIHKKRKTKARKLTQQKWSLFVNHWWFLNAKMLHFLNVSITI